MPNLEAKIIRHRRRVQEKTIQDFVEWLNINDMLQNLAYGEKIVKYTNGFHVAIESVKRTKSITHIIRQYYRDFLKGRSEETGEDKDDAVLLENEDDELDDSDIEENQRDDENQCE